MFRKKTIAVAVALVLLIAMATVGMAIHPDLEYREKNGLPVEGDVNIIDAGDGGTQNDTTNTPPTVPQKPEPKPASKGVAVYVNGEYVMFPDEQPFVNKDGRTMVPIRFVSQGLGAKVDWEQLTKKVGISLNDIDIFLWIGSKKYQVAGVEKTMDTMPVLINGRTFVPVRFIAEAFGAKVDWYPDTRKVTVDMR